MLFITQTATDTIAEGIEAAFSLIAFAFIIRLAILIGTAALITWVVKLVWNGGRKNKKTKHSDDWLYNAQNRQNMTYEYSDPVIHHNNTKSKKKSTWKNPQWTPSGWVYNEKTGRWNGPDYLQKNGRKMSPTGWTFNEETQLWEPPESIQRESAQRWEWDEEKKIWVDRDKKRRGQQ